MKTLYADNLAGFQIAIMENPLLEKGKAVLMAHPDDVAYLKKSFENEDTTHSQDSVHGA